MEGDGLGEAETAGGPCVGHVEGPPCADIGLLLEPRGRWGVGEVKQHGHATRDAEVDGFRPDLALGHPRGPEQHACLDRRQRRVMQIQQPLGLFRIRAPSLPRRVLRQLGVRGEPCRQARDAEEDDLGHAAIGHGRLQARLVEQAVERDVDVPEVQINQLLGQRAVRQQRRRDEAGGAAVLLVERGVLRPDAAEAAAAPAAAAEGVAVGDGDGLELDGAEDALLGAVVAAGALSRAQAFSATVAVRTVSVNSVRWGGRVTRAGGLEGLPAGCAGGKGPHLIAECRSAPTNRLMKIIGCRLEDSFNPIHEFAMRSGEPRKWNFEANLAEAGQTPTKRVQNAGTHT